MKQSKTYPNIDMIKTGLQLKEYIKHAGLTVKDIQEILHLSCPQPVYRWMNGKILPSVDHLLTLSKLFGVHMEDLLVTRPRESQTAYCVLDKKEFQKRISTYYKSFIRSAA